MIKFLRCSIQTWPGPPRLE